MKLQTYRWTSLPGTNVMVRWDDGQEITVYRHRVRLVVEIAESGDSFHIAEMTLLPSA